MKYPTVIGAVTGALDTLIEQPIQNFYMSIFEAKWDTTGHNWSIIREIFWSIAQGIIGSGLVVGSLLLILSDCTWLI